MADAWAMRTLWAMRYCFVLVAMTVGCSSAVPAASSARVDASASDDGGSDEASADGPRWVDSGAACPSCPVDAGAGDDAGDATGDDGGMTCVSSAGNDDPDPPSPACMPTGPCSLCGVVGVPFYRYRCAGAFVPDPPLNCKVDTDGSLCCAYPECILASASNNLCNGNLGQPTAKACPIDSDGGILAPITHPPGCNQPPGQTNAMIWCCP